MFDFIKNFSQMKGKMAEIQAELSRQEVEAESGGGAVVAKANGTGQLVRLEIKDELLAEKDVEMLQDLIVAAVNEAQRRAQELAKKEMLKLTGGMKLPGLF